MDVLAFGRQLLILGTCLTGMIFVLSLAGILRKDRRFVTSARVGLYALFMVVGGSALSLVYGFVAGIYDCTYVYDYSEKLLPLSYKIAGLWGGLNGSLLFWTFLVAVFAALVGFQHRYSSRHPTGRRLEPYVYLVLTSVLFFFCLISWKQNPFEIMDFEKRLRLASGHGIPLDPSGSLTDGAGLNQQLVNYWFVIHPPTLYLGLTAWTVPFAFALAALMAGELGDYWIRIVRRWSLVAWVFLTSGIILGGLWAYRQLGWGGYWAWDPVENASFLPWCTGTAFLHSIMIQERRDMLKAWNVFLIGLSFFLTIVATWMTRSGVVDSVHAFAGGDNIGEWFQVFLFVIAGASFFIFALRFRQLRGTDRLDSLLCREAAFFLNNWILVIIAAVVFFLSFYDKISHDWFGKTLKNPGIFNMLTAPCFAVLLFLTAVGPLLGWVKTSGVKLRNNFAWPFFATVLFVAGVYAFLGSRGLLGTWKEILVPDISLRNPHPSAFYPTGLFLGLSFFIVATVSYELLRGMRSRIVDRKEDLITAFLNLVVRQNRRYGGYLVHTGIAVLTTGIIASSMFRIKIENEPMTVGKSVDIGPYRVTVVKRNMTDEPRPGEPYLKDEALFRVTSAPSSVLPEAHGASDAAGSKEGGSEAVIAELHSERRFYPKKQEWISEVSIHRRLLEDIYIYYPRGDDNGQGNLYVTIFLNPLMMLIYLGWFIMIAGAVFAALPISGSKVGLSE